MLRSASSEEALLVVLEAQLGEDAIKALRWPLYVAGAHNRTKTPTILVVVTDSAKVAQWASRPIDVGLGRMVLRPFVLGPEQIPHDLDLEEARRHPILAVLAVVAHGRSEAAGRIVSVALEAVRPLVERGDPLGMLAMDVIAAFIDETRLAKLKENEMDLELLPPVSEFGKRHFARGREEGLRHGREEGLRHGREHGREDGFARALLTVLETRGLGMTDVIRAKVMGCHDVELLGTWLRRASTAEDLWSVFDDETSR